MATTKMVAREITYAPTAFSLLRGVFCLYKPPKKGFGKTQLALRQKLVQELNSMEVRPPRKRIEITGDLAIAPPPSSSSEATSSLKVQVLPNLADHPLVCGPRYAESHFSIQLLNNPGWYSSGLVLGLIGSVPDAGRLVLNLRPLSRVYELKGELGFTTDDHTDEGKVIFKSTWKHVTRDRFERILAKVEAAQRTGMFTLAGVDLRSEEAYQMAIKGMAPPKTKETKPHIYALRSVRFEPPHFTIQVQVINEAEAFLAELVAEIGLALRSTARCTGIRLLNFGPFSVDHALLSKHWNLENLIENVDTCTRLAKKYGLFEPQFKRRKSSDQVEDQQKSGVFAEDGVLFK